MRNDQSTQPKCLKTKLRCLPDPFRAACASLLCAILALCGATLWAQTPIPANAQLVAPSAIPKFGTFFSLYKTKEPPLPFLKPMYAEAALPVYWLGGNRYLIDDTALDWDAIRAQQQLAPASAGMSAFGSQPFNSSPVMYGPTFDTNALWLEITNVANGFAYANLHNGTNQVYGIWATTNLATPFSLWQVETDVWPADTNCQPFTVLTLGRPDLFLRAQDWTGVDSDNDGIPDWWIWKYFGDLSHTATDPDCLGESLLYYYPNGLDPNPLSATSFDVSLCAATAVNLTLSAWPACYTPARGVLYSILVPPQHGSLTGTPGPDGTYAYTPTNADFTGTDSFSYLASIAWGGNSVTGQVNIVVGDAYLCPNSQAAMTGTNQPVSLLLTASGWLNCSNLSYAITAWPTNGALSGTPPNVVYSPYTNLEGEDHFSFTVSNGVWGSVCGDGAVTLYVVAGPTDFTAQCSTNGYGVSLSWSLDAIVQNLVQQGFTISGFEIYRRSTLGSFTTNDIIFAGTDPAQTDYLDENAVPNDTYHYVVAFEYRDPYTGNLYHSPFSAQAIVTACCPPHVGGSLWVNTGPTPLELAQWLMGTNPVVITNATYTGAVEACGIFGNGNGVGLNGHQFPIDHGLILASGNIANAIGPNGSSRVSTPFYPGNGDDDLDNLVSNNGTHDTHDAAVLEFDIIATNAFTVTFHFVFASEEYPEYIRQFNDPMAIFVSTNHDNNKWINSITNDLALVPETTNAPVSVNSVNGGCTDTIHYANPANPLYYVDNHDPNFSAMSPYGASEPVYNLQYDGYTVLLGAQSNLSANVIYHIKIAVADYGDSIYDSAVFIRTQSFPCQ